MSRVLLLTLDRVAARMAGPAIRAWELARVLSAHHQVSLLAIDGAEASHPGFQVIDGTTLSLREAEEVARRHDVVVVQAGGALRRYSFLPAIGSLTLVIDLYDPVLFENLLMHHAHESWGLEVPGLLLEQMACGDFFICASQRQRDHWLGMLAAAGRINPRTMADDVELRRLIDLVPFGVPDAPPEDTAAPVIRGVMPGVGAGDIVLLWGGGIWDWFDPLTVIRAMGQVAAAQPEVKLVFMGIQHPHPGIPRMKMTSDAVQLSQELGLHGRSVFFNESWVAYDQRAAYLREADIGVTAHFPSIETRYSFRTRVLDYLWAGLPVITTEGDEMAELTRAHGLGQVIGYGDVQGWASAISALSTSSERRQECARRARALSESFRWPKAAAPLAAFCQRPRRAPDRPPTVANAIVGPQPPPAPPSFLERARQAYREGGPLGVLRGVGRLARRLVGA